VTGRPSVDLIVGGIFVFWAASKEKAQAAWTVIREMANKGHRLRERGSLAVVQMVAMEGTPLSQIIRGFMPRRYHIVLVTGKDMKVRGSVTEAQILDALMRLGHGATVEQVLRLP